MPDIIHLKLNKNYLGSAGFSSICLSRFNSINIIEIFDNIFVSYSYFKNSDRTLDLSYFEDGFLCDWGLFIAQIPYLISNFISFINFFI